MQSDETQSQGRQRNKAFDECRSKLRWDRFPCNFEKPSTWAHRLLLGHYWLPAIIHLLHQHQETDDQLIHCVAIPILSPLLCQSNWSFKWGQRETSQAL